MVNIKEDYGCITDIKKFSTHDGPGIRTTVFFKGCPLNCNWCANPETINKNNELYFIQSRCNQCMNCIDICNTEAISFDNGIRVDREKCNHCFECVNVCFNQSLLKVGYKISSEELIETLLKDKPFYKNGGGVTFSGGEPMQQKEFLMNMLIKSKENMLHTVLDTCGYAQRNFVSSIVKYVDMTLLDIKHMDDKKHKAATGVSNKTILNNAELFAKNTLARISIPLIHDFNDDELNLNEVASFAKDLNIRNVDINLLHKFGEQKYNYLGKKSPYNKYKIEFDEDKIKRIIDIFNKKSIEITFGRNF